MTSIQESHHLCCPVIALSHKLSVIWVISTSPIFVKLSLELLLRPNPLDLQLSLFEICLGMICPRNSGLVVWSWWLFEKARIAVPKLLDAVEAMLLHLYLKLLTCLLFWSCCCVVRQHDDLMMIFQIWNEILRYVYQWNIFCIRVCWWLLTEMSRPR